MNRGNPRPARADDIFRRRTVDPIPGRPDRIALWAVVMAVFAILVSAASAHADSSQGASSPSGGAVAPGPPTDTSYQDAEFGQRILRRGMRGTDVRVMQSLLRGQGFGPLRIGGVFDAESDVSLRNFQRAAGIPADGVLSTEAGRELVRRMQVRRVTFYGPGFFGNRTACGRKLERDTIGVAHRSLPCGTPVTFSYRGRFLTAKVIDRGPFREGYSWDLTLAAARRLGLRQSGSVRSAFYVSNKARVGRASLAANRRTAIAPPDAPPQVRKAIAWANRITRKPYRYGGGHASFKSGGYDCSGAISYALRGAGALKRPLDSRAFSRWGRRGRGNWITVYTNPGHAYMVIAGLRFDTSGSGGRGPRWRADSRSPRGYAARHWVGL